MKKPKDKLKQILAQVFATEPAPGATAPAEEPAPAVAEATQTEPVAAIYSVERAVLAAAAAGPVVSKAFNKKRKPARPKPRVEELSVRCREAPPESADLTDVVGWLAISYDPEGRVVSMLFDPAPNGHANAEAALRGILRSADRIALAETAEEGGGRWQFEIIEDASIALDEEEDDEDELEVDYDACDYACDEDHPFNHGGV